MPLEDDTKKGDKELSELSECLFSQYYFTAAAVAGVTGYALAKKPKHGLAYLFVAGAAGGLSDLGYGWTVACRDQVVAFTTRRKQEHDEKQPPPPRSPPP